MSCSTCPPEACYNGCVEITSDACVRYTGIDSEALGITTGDSLLTVENILIEKVVSFLDGTGIDITINPSYYCELVSQYLPIEGTPNLVEILSALVRAACDLKTQADATDVIVAEINSPYTVDCLTGVDETSTTHEVLQAVIIKLCATANDLISLTLDLDTNYVKLSDLNTLIQAYLDSVISGGQQYLKMVPYTVLEYYGPLTNFDGTGAGISTLGYDKIYLCNGLNGTPDKRGRVGVGAIVDVPGGPLDAAVDPTYAGNPNYAVLDTDGANSVALLTSQLPSHTHNASASASVTDPGHTHNISYLDKGNPGDGTSTIDISGPSTVTTSSSTTGISVSVSVSNSSTGDGAAHANIQPVLASYYIMYIP
jgi:microcystin-dependent protein